MKHVEKHIHGILEKTFRDYKTNFSASSKESISNFTKEFINNLDKNLDLDVAYLSTQSKEAELIRNIDQIMVLSNINTPDNILMHIKDLVEKYKEDK